METEKNDLLPLPKSTGRPVQRIKSNREVQLEIGLKCGINLLTHAITAVNILDPEGSVIIASQLLQGKNKLIKILEGQNGV